MTNTYLYGANVWANDIRQHYLRFGGQSDGRDARDPVIVIPGITSPVETWRFVAERLGRHFDTYVLDARGRGLSQAMDDLDYSLDAMAADVIAFVKALSLPSCSIVGHSMGGRIGIRVAGQRPAGIKRLVAVDPPVSGPGRRPYPAKLEWYVDSIRQAQRGISVEQMRQYCPTWTEEQLRLRAQWLHTCNERAITESFHAFQTDDIHADFARIDVPVLLMAAERGDVIRDSDMNELLQLLPSMQHVRVKDAGHMIPWDNEPGFYQAFGDFLGRPLDE